MPDSRTERKQIMKTKNARKRENRREQAILLERRKIHPSDARTIASLQFTARPKAAAKHTTKVAAIYRDVQQITIRK